MISDDGTGTEFTVETAGAAFREACATAGLDPTGAELLRLGSNAVYSLSVVAGHRPCGPRL
ncbi:hypothetical protein [Actinacidiphila soli]|uniref:hypothetical protein n=1 Tax=Actinacidiphila soli TaxID=2487275 RepID=UPI002AFE0D85|nr:hypothetical protein [Actinacidiphila soli]